MTFHLGNKAIVSLLLLLFSYGIQASNCVPEPKQNRLIHDFANVLTDQEEMQIERHMVAFNDTTSTQIAIVTLNDLCGIDKAQLATEIGENWGVGNKKFDNGVVILIKPKTASSRGQAFIAQGYGLEGVLPDITLKRIIDHEMIPFFKKGDYYNGIAISCQRVMELAGGEYSAEQYGKRTKGKTSVIPFFVVLIIMIVVFGSTIGRARRYAHTNNIGLWTALWLMGSTNSRHRGHYNNFTSGGGGFGGFGGGGFGGFGGGSFGGGGAGGSW